MTGFEIYTLIICLFVYVLFIALFSIFIYMLTKSHIKMMEGGLEDEQIRKEYAAELNKKGKEGIIFKVIPVLFCIILAVLFAFASYSALTQDEKVGPIPTVKVVSSGSMSMKYEGNKYLFTNNLNNQIETFDLIVLHELPKEEDLKLYDIVVYEVGGTLLVHRIVGIEEKCPEHPDERYFLLQGDNVQYPDKFPVKYSQMKSIYKNERIPFVGSFVFFMQSPAGVLCFLLTVFGIIAINLVEKKVLKARDARMTILLEQDKQFDVEQERVETVVEDDINIRVIDFEDIDLDDDYYANAKRLTFDEKVALLSKERALWLQQVISVVKTISGISERKSKNGITYKVKSKPVLKLSASRGYVYVNLAVDPNLFADKIQYGVKDSSDLKAYALYPAQIKLTSQRKALCIEKILVEKFGAQKCIVITSGYYGRKRRTFKSKLASLPKERKDWYKEIVKTLLQKEKISQRESKNAVTFKRGRTPIAKIGISGKSLRVYLNVNPALYSAKQYGAKDVSSIKAHTSYPAMFRVTSQRKTNYIKQIIEKL